MKIKKSFFEDNVLKNPVVFVLLSQKMKIIHWSEKSICSILKTIKNIANQQADSYICPTSPITML
jgi:hypothetical protein